MQSSVSLKQKLAAENFLQDYNKNTKMNELNDMSIVRLN